MDKQRLQRIADLIRTIPEEKFDMETWWANKGNGCQSIGCAIGWAIKADILPEMELREWTQDYTGKKLIFPALKTASDGSPYLTPGWSINGISQALQISEYEARWLFSPDEYMGDNKEGEITYNASPSIVAGRIEEFIKTNGESRAHE